MKRVARFITRGTTSDGLGEVDLILGSAFKNSGLKPNTVYEISEVLDTWIIKAVGPSLIGSSPKTSTVEDGSWMSSVDQILESHGRPPVFILTVSEYTTGIYK